MTPLECVKAAQRIVKRERVKAAHDARIIHEAYRNGEASLGMTEYYAGKLDALTSVLAHLLQIEYED